jgi:hypothetical protein
MTIRVRKIFSKVDKGRKNIIHDVRAARLVKVPKVSTTKPTDVKCPLDSKLSPMTNNLFWKTEKEEPATQVTPTPGPN